MNKLTVLLGASLVLSIMASCTTVRGYQKAYLNNEDMELSGKKLESFETNFAAYREGAAGANGGKVGGGCGCN